VTFDGKRVIVTGASRGIGRALVGALVTQGAIVAASARSLDGLAETRAGVTDARRVHLCPGDLRRAIDRETIVADTPAEEIDEVLEVGLMGGFHLTRLVLPGMMRARAGKVVFLSCGFSGPTEAAGWVHYYVANKAIDALVAGLAAELRPHNIQVNAVAPWFVATEAVRAFYADQTAAALEPASVVDMALFLASPRADHVSGQTIELRSKTDV
jgi:3-oxoacyl-[acyl-carrier protein] reductase